MRVLLDNNVNRRFSSLIAGFEVVHIQEIGWQDLQNGELLSAAETAGYDVPITADRRMQYQQNLRERTISAIVLNSHRITYVEIARLAPQVTAALNALTRGSFVNIQQD